MLITLAAHLRGGTWRLVVFISFISYAGTDNFIGCIGITTMVKEE
jgi:hypothetical protein